MATSEIQRERRPVPSPRTITTEPRLSDKVFRAIVTAGGLSSLVILGLIAIFLLYQGYEVLIEEGFSFITSSTWEVITDEYGEVQSYSFGIAALVAFMAWRRKLFTSRWMLRIIVANVLLVGS